MRRVVSWMMVGAMVVGCCSAALAGNRNWNRGEKGSGDLVTESRQLEAFTSIKSTGSFDIEVTVGEPQAVSLTFDDNLIDNIKMEVRRGELRLETEGSYSSRRACKVVISVPTLEAFESTGSGDVRIDNLDAETFECRLAGSGSVYAVGKVDELDIDISGSGDVDARDLKARDVYARISGSGDIDVYATESISGRVSGSGDIFYRGNPEHTSLKVSGSGTIRRR